MGAPTTVLIGERLGKKPMGIITPCPQKMGIVMPTVCSIQLQQHTMQQGAQVGVALQGPQLSLTGNSLSLNTAGIAVLNGFTLYGYRCCMLTRVQGNTDT